jgi:hypothetical protein
MRYAIWMLATLCLDPQTSHTAAQPRAAAEALLVKYVNAVGGTAAVSVVTSRVTRGTFDNGRGLVEPFVTWVKTPDKLATQIGGKAIADAAGSGRATDGRIGWDKNFVGTGLRDLTGNELVDVKRAADPFRAVHLVTTCPSLAVEDRVEPRGAAGPIVRCDRSDGTERWSLNPASGLVERLDYTSRAGRTTTIYYDDYRRADGLLTPFRERIVVPGATITYTAATIRYNETVPDSVFSKPSH